MRYVKLNDNDTDARTQEEGCCGFMFYSREQVAAHRERNAGRTNVPLMASARHGCGAARTRSDLRRDNLDFQAQLQARLATINPSTELN